MVFNCDEGIDCSSMARMFAGIVQCGAWGVFDEFNRLAEDQLSAVSLQVQAIQDALSSGARSVQLLGKPVPCDAPHAGIFVTLNPAGRGYGGRSRLPDNLSQLFRPVAMTAPDATAIAEVTLRAEGFSCARDLGRTIASVFAMCAALMPPQQHYDWGLRAMKAVLAGAASELARARRQAEGGRRPEAEGEAAIVVRALRLATLGKLTPADAGRFGALLRDAFPGGPAEAAVAADAARSHELRAPLAAAFAALGLQPTERQGAVVLQLRQALSQRIGCVLLGAPGSGKTSAWRMHVALQAALGGPAVEVHMLAPKALPRARLLGSLDADTREWTDGVLTAAARAAACAAAAGRHALIVCDGDVDPEWVEALNSALDDSRLLSLPNGERVSLAGLGINILLETHDLRHASPATVSRLGVVLLGDEDVQPAALVASWLSAQPAAHRDSLAAHCDALLYRALDAVAACAIAPAPPPAALASSALAALSGCSGDSRAEVALRLARGLSGFLAAGAARTFAVDILAWAGIRVPSASHPLDLELDVTQGALVARAAPRASAGASLVPTPSLLRAADALAQCALQGAPVLLLGPPGCGKAATVRFVAEAVLPRCSLEVLNCTVATTSEHVLAALARACVLHSSASGRVLRPRRGERVLLHVASAHLPALDGYGTSSALALLAALIATHGFYDTRREWVRVERLSIVLTALPGAPLHPRLVGMLHPVAQDEPSREELQVITHALLRCAAAARMGGEAASPAAAPHDKDARSEEALGRLAGAMVALHCSVAASLPPGGGGLRGLYSTTLRELCGWTMALARGVGEQGGGSQRPAAAMPDASAVAYEAERTYRDRLVDAADCARFDALLSAALSPAQPAAAAAAGGGGSSCIFTTLCGGGSSVVLTAARTPSRTPLPAYRAVLARGMELYEREERRLELVLTGSLLRACAAVERALSAPGGCALLLGPAGCGKRSVACLMAHLLSLPLICPPTGRAYTARHFAADARGALLAAGARNEPTLLLLESRHTAGDDRVLEGVNALLASGEMPGLWDEVEMAAILAPLKEAAAAEAAASATEMDSSPHAFFVRSVRRNLHVVVTADPSEEGTARALGRNPSLTSRAAVICMCSEWDEASARELASGLLPPDTLLATGLPLAPLIGAACALHESRRKVTGASPRDLRFALRVWASLLSSRGAALSVDAARLAAGLEALRAARLRVDELQAEALGATTALAAQQAAADASMEAITIALGGAGDRRAEVAALQAALGEAAEAARVQKDAIGARMTEVAPTLAAAQAAVGGIRKEHLDEIRSLKLPPEALADVLGGVLALLGVTDTSWLSMKRFLAGRGVKEEILAFDARRLGAEPLAAVQRLLRAKTSSFDRADNVSKAAGPLAEWVRANVSYALVLRDVAPLQAELDSADARAASAAEELARNAAELAGLDDAVGALKRDFTARTGEAEVLRSALARTQRTLARARTLLADLAGEGTRWQARSEALRVEAVVLPVLALLAGAYTAYLGTASEGERELALRDWRSVLEVHLPQLAEGLPPASRDAILAAPARFDLVTMLASEREQAAWRSSGLPPDALSVANAVVLAAVAGVVGRGGVLLVDPGGAATTWLARKLEAAASVVSGTPLDEVRATDARLLQAAELAVRHGRALLIRDITSVEPFLVALLRREGIARGGRTVVYIGDRCVDLHERFALFLTTRAPDARDVLPPGVASLLTCASFTVTHSGLEAQLLVRALDAEAPQLAARQAALRADAEQRAAELTATEDALLACLAGSGGGASSLLENEPLLEQLTGAKAQVERIAQALAQASATARELEAQREVYRPLAALGSRLYFCAQRLALVNALYAVGLPLFMQLYARTLSASAAAHPAAVHAGGSAVARVSELCGALEQLVFLSVGEGLFKADRLAWALHIIYSSRPSLWCLEAGGAGGLDAGGSAEPSAAWRLLLTDDDTLQSLSFQGAPLPPPWAGPDVAAAYRELVALLPRGGARVLGLDSDARWAEWARGPMPETSFPPLSTPLLASPLVRLLLVRTFRWDRLLHAATAFALSALRLDSVNPPPPSLRGLAGCCPPGMPLLLLSTSGADPSRELAELAPSAGCGESPLEEVACTGGASAASAALRAVAAAAERGGWLLLSNVHLAPSVGAALAGMLADGPTPHARFRLWMTAAAHGSLPPVLLRAARAATFESPPGVRANLLRTLGGWSGLLGRGSPLRAQLLFLLAWLHAVLQERRRFVPMGWSKAYDWGGGDLRAGVGVLEAMLPRGGSGSGGGARVPWAYVHGLLEGTVFGGRVDNTFDARILRAYLAHALHPEVLANQRQVSRGLTLPDSAADADYVALAEGLPATDAPALFALPPNSSRAGDRVAVAHTLSALQRLGEGSERGAGNSSLSRRGALAVARLRTQWQEALASASAAPRASTRGASPSPDAPLAAFLDLECRIARELAGCVAHDLATAEAAFAHTSAPMPEALLELSSALSEGSVPRAWAARWQAPHSAVTPWLAGLLRRAAALERWSDALAPGPTTDAASMLRALPGGTLALRDVLRPAALLTALRLATARACTPPVSAATLRLAWAWDAAGVARLASASALPPLPLAELRMQGARWDAQRGGLCEPAQADDDLTPAPRLCLAWLPAGVPDPPPAPPATTTLAVPLYLAADRDCLVAEVAAPCGADKARWVLAGLALFVE